MTSPGDSSVPASAEPSMTASAPAAIAFATSPEYRIPPSAMSGTPSAAQMRAQSWIAVTCGTPAPRDNAGRADRPGAYPRLDAVHSRLDERLGRLGGRDVP